MSRSSQIGSSEARAPVTLDGRFTFDALARLPDYDSANSQAYAARDDREGDRLVARVAGRNFPRRLAMLERFSGQIDVIDGLPRVRAHGRVTMPDGTGAWVGFFDPPPGPPVVANLRDRFPPVSEQALRSDVLPSLLVPLKAIWRRGMAHRGIRPDNMYWAGPLRTAIVLGECFTEPPGMGQPVSFEPLERAFCVREGRGEGTPQDDLFALGVTVLALSLGEMPWLRIDDEKMLAARLARGSYQAIAEGAQLAPGILSLIRGLMRDDTEERWTLDDVTFWLEGGAPPIRAGAGIRPFLSPFPFGGDMPPDRRRLAAAFARRHEEAARVIRGENFRVWLTYGFADPYTAAEIERLIETSQERRVASADLMLVARVISLLDPAGPLRYGDLVFAADGLEPVLSSAMTTGDRERIRALDAILGSGLLANVAEANGTSGAAVNTLQRVQAASDLMGRRDLGWGLERCLYSLIPGFACLSPRLPQGHVSTLPELMAALEGLAASGDERLLPLDRHVVAFALARGAEARYALGIVNAGDDAAPLALATLLFLAAIQIRTGTRSPNLAAFFAQRLKFHVDSIREKNRRQALADRVEKVAAAGDLVALAECLDPRREVQADASAFQAARAKFAANRRRLAELERLAVPSDAPVQELGHTIAAAIGAIPLALVCLYLIFGGVR